MYFGNLQQKLESSREVDEAVNANNRLEALKKGLIVFSTQNTAGRVLNAHGKFYGLRSKYDGRGNLRKPVRA